MAISRLGGCSGELTFGHAGVLASPRKEGRGVCCDAAHTGLVSVRKSSGKCLHFCRAFWASLMLRGCPKWPVPLKSAVVLFRWKKCFTMTMDIVCISITDLGETHRERERERRPSFPLTGSGIFSIN